MSKKRNYHTAEQKMAILREHLVEKKPISDICENNELQPSAFYRWQKELFDNGELCFEKKKNTGKSRIDPQSRKLEDKLVKLNSKLDLKNEVIAELMEEHIKLKKTFGES